MTHLTTYSVSDSVNSTGALALNGVPKGANSGTLAISAAYFNSRDEAAATAEAASRLTSGFSDGARVGVARAAGYKPELSLARGEEGVGKKRRGGT